MIIGNDCLLGNNNSFIVVRKILIGDKCLTGHNNEFMDSDMHSIDPELRHKGQNLKAIKWIAMKRLERQGKMEKGSR